MFHGRSSDVTVGPKASSVASPAAKMPPPANSINAPDELGESGDILIRYGAPALLLILEFTVVRSFGEISRQPPLRTRYSELVTVVGAVAFLIVMLVLFHPTPALQETRSPN